MADTMKKIKGFLPKLLIAIIGGLIGILLGLMYINAYMVEAVPPEVEQIRVCEGDYACIG
jgi:hypothetical protein